MNVSCPSKFTRYSEFVILESCSIPIVGNIILKSVIVLLAGIILFLEIFCVFCRYHDMCKKSMPHKMLLMWTLIQNPIMMIRPLINLLWNIYSINHIWMAFLSHLAAASAAGIGILFLYIELKIIRKGSIKKYSSIKYPQIILTIITITQFMLFLIGPILVYYTDIKAHHAFWVPLIAVDFTVIPYFSYLGISIYRKILKMVNDDYYALSTQILITVLICGIIGVVTGVMGIVCCFYSEIEWVIIDLCWIGGVVFNGVIFTLLSRQPVRQPINSNSTSV